MISATLSCGGKKGRAGRAEIQGCFDGCRRRQRKCGCEWYPQPGDGERPVPFPGARALQNHQKRQNKAPEDLRASLLDGALNFKLKTESWPWGSGLRRGPGGTSPMRRERGKAQAGGDLLMGIVDKWRSRWWS